MIRRFLVFILLACLAVSAFSQVAFTDSNLPIVIINTDAGVDIPDSPRAMGTMTIIYRGEGLRNFLTDQNTPAYVNYKGRISIEIRGSASQVLPKKQYGFSTLKEDNITEDNTKLLGLPSDNDWILNGFGFEPALMRDYICYNLSRRIGEYASRTVYCEVVLNGTYNGIYLLEEKIKQGSNRVDVAKMEKIDNTFPKITGGYIIKADKTTGGDPVFFTMSSYIGVNDVAFINEYPKPENISASQKTYIKNVFDLLSYRMSTGNSSLLGGFPSVIDVPSFVDYMIINELGSNSDAYQYSTFFHKDRNGKLRAGPIWDLNLTFGYDLSIWGYDRSKTNNWQFSNGDNEGARFWRDLFFNPEFKCQLYKRWTELTKPGHPLNYFSIAALIDSTTAKITEAAERDNLRWYNVYDFDLQREATKIKDFLAIRIPFMTQGISPASNCPDIVSPPLVITKIMYHPDSTMLFPGSESQEFIEIKNTGTQTVDLTGVYFSGTGFVYQFPPYSEIFPNSTRIIAGDAEVFTAKYGFPPFGQFTRSLSNSGERLVLSDGYGNVIDSVYYHDRAPWPDADGNGYYLELADPLSDNSLGENWTLSSNTIVSVNETENSERLKVYPSPVKSDLTVEFSGRIQSIELFDFQGRMITKTYPDSEVFTLNMSTCSPGIYLVRIITSEGILMRKLIKE
jgi:hypothetical protein